MASDNFVDYVKIFCKSGKGGAGSRHFFRAKYIPKGGPDGGDGGRGGHVILRGNKQMWTLLHLKFKKHIKATDGVSGGENLMTGAQGKDVIIEVPIGTVARDAETNEILFEITEDKQEGILRKGGRGGKGNTFFKTATNQAPDYAQPGEDCEEGWSILELKILADIGLVGFPNAGKSTLLSVITAAKPEIGDYPFTTLRPNLGMVEYRGDKSFIVADIPGIIEGAHEGKGIGLRFLRHIERNSALLFLIPADSKDIQEEYDILLNELRLYNPELLDKRRILAISKSDLLDEELENEIRAQIKDLDPIFISAVSGKNLTQLKDLIWKTLQDD
ncbi:MAG: GTPase ObgE [Brumimicrobium sp.]|nr:GTPase ObgE [Brumimicrobium sp.]MCO5269864.1 GTPase ObgE [Brumimicrobium sp.]